MPILAIADLSIDTQLQLAENGVHRPIIDLLEAMNRISPAGGYHYGMYLGFYGKFLGEGVADDAALSRVVEILDGHVIPM